VSWIHPCWLFGFSGSITCSQPAGSCFVTRNVRSMAYSVLFENVVFTGAVSDGDS
jgi:hypothetical protein